MFLFTLKPLKTQINVMDGQSSVHPNVHYDRKTNVTRILVLVLTLSMYKICIIHFRVTYQS